MNPVCGYITLFKLTGFMIRPTVFFSLENKI